MRMQNPRQAVRAFARPHQLAGPRARSNPVPHAQQLLHPPRPLLHQDRRCLSIHQAIAGRNRVCQMQRHVLLAAHRHGDPTLRIRGIRLGQAFLGDHQNAACFGQGYRGPQPCNPTTHHQKINSAHCLRLAPSLPPLPVLTTAN